MHVIVVLLRIRPDSPGRISLNGLNFLERYPIFIIKRNSIILCFHLVGKLVEIHFSVPNYFR